MSATRDQDHPVDIEVENEAKSIGENQLMNPCCCREEDFLAVATNTCIDVQQDITGPHPNLDNAAEKIESTAHRTDDVGLPDVSPISTTVAASDAVDGIAKSEDSGVCNNEDDCGPAPLKDQVTPLERRLEHLETELRRALDVIAKIEAVEKTLETVLLKLRTVEESNEKLTAENAKLCSELNKAKAPESTSLPPPPPPPPPPSLPPPPPPPLPPPPLQCSQTATPVAIKLRTSTVRTAEQKSQKSNMQDTMSELLERIKSKNTLKSTPSSSLRRSPSRDETASEFQQTFQLKFGRQRLSSTPISTSSASITDTLPSESMTVTNKSSLRRAQSTQLPKSVVSELPELQVSVAPV